MSQRISAPKGLKYITFSGLKNKLNIELFLSDSNDWRYDLIVTENYFMEIKHKILFFLTLKSSFALLSMVNLYSDIFKKRCF